MSDNGFLEAASESVRSYLNVFERDRSDLEVAIQPYFTPEGDLVRIKCDMYSEETGVSIGHDIEMENGFRDTEVVEYESYEDWLNDFTETFSEVDVQYEPVNTIESLIDGSIDEVKTFKKMSRLDNEELVILLDAFPKEDDSWAVEYYVKSSDDIDKRYTLDSKFNLEEYDEECVIGEIYPLWVNKFREEFGEVQYTDATELWSHYGLGN